MTVTTADIVNESLNLIGYDGPPVTGAAPNFDTSTAGQAAAKLYAPAWQAVVRMNTWDCVRATEVMTLTGNPAPYPWSYEYYTPNGFQIWQVMPQALADPNNPTPSDWIKGVSVVNNVQQSVIWTNISGAQAVYAYGPLLPQSWDALLRACVVRYLAAEFAVSLLGKPDLAQSLFSEVAAMVQVSAMRTDT